MDLRIESYEEFANDWRRRTPIKYHDHPTYGPPKCFIAGCDKPGYYEGGDARFYCGMCEEHVGIKDDYRRYLADVERTLRLRAMWDKSDPTIAKLYDEVKKAKEVLNESNQ